jgi:hypothetical protein
VAQQEYRTFASLVVYALDRYITDRERESDKPSALTVGESE